MENELQRAVQCCVDPSVSPDIRQQAFAYLAQLKNTPGSWQMFVNFYFQFPTASVESKFFALQALEETLCNRLAPISPEQIATLRQSLMTFLSNEYLNRSVLETSATRNKFAQIIAILFDIEYLTTWTTFFDDLIALLPQGPVIVDIFLRIMLTIDDELISRTIHRSDSETTHGGLLKDAMRERSIVTIVDVWYDILVRYHQTNPDIVNLCLSVVKVYVEWIDVGLIASKRFVEALFTFLNNRLLRESACECVNEIVLKGMRPVGKIQLVQALQLPRLLTSFVDASKDPYEVFLTKVAQLFNDLGVVLSSCWAELGESDLSNSSSGGTSSPAGNGRGSSTPAPMYTPEQLQVQRQAQVDCFALLSECFPAVFKLLSSENETIARIVSSFSTAILGIYKQEKRTAKSLSPANEQTLASLLRVILGRLQYSDELGLALPDIALENETSEETEFEQLRKILRNQVESIAGLDDVLVYTLVSDTCMETLANLQNKSLIQVELVLYLINLLGDSIRGQIKYTRDPSSNPEGSRPVEVRLSALLASIINSNISACPNAVIQMAYMDTLVRFSRYFEIVPEALSPAVMSFLDTRGLHHSNLTVRSHAMRQFVKFVRALKLRLFAHIGTILNLMQDLLSVTASLTPPASQYSSSSISPTFRALTTRRRRSSSFNDPSNGLFNDQLNLFEVAGLLISHEQLDAAERVRFIQTLLSPIADLMQKVVKQGLVKLDTDENPFHIMSLHHAIYAVGSVAKGFPVHSGTIGGWEDSFITTLQLTLMVMDATPQSEILKDAARFMFQRLVPAVGKAILPMLAPSVVRLLRDAQMRDIIDFVPLLSQLIFRFKGDIAVVLDEILGELLERTHNFLSTAVTNGSHVNIANAVATSGIVAGTSYEALVLVDLKKAYLSLLGATLNEIGLVFTSERNQRHLDAVLANVVQMASSLDNDNQVIKNAITVLVKMTDVFTFQGFAEFALDRILPIPFVVPSSPSFNGSDAQTALLLVNELAGLQRHLVLKYGQKAVDVLGNQLVFIGLPQPSIQEYIQAALSSDPKVIRNYYKAVLSSRK